MSKLKKAIKENKIEKVKGCLLRCVIQLNDSLVNVDFLLTLSIT